MAERMTWDDWCDLTDRLNVLYPHQQIDELTGRGWYDTQLHKYPREQVGRALARCVGTVEFISCYAIVQAIETEKREHQAYRSTTLPLPARSWEVPPEVKAIRSLMERAMLDPDHPDHLAGPLQSRIDEIHQYREMRLAEESTAPRRERFA